MNQTASASLQQFAVSYTIPCEHRVSVGVTTASADEAIARVREAIDAGTVRDDTAEMPLLEDRHVEHPPGIEGDVAKRLVIGATRVAGEFEIHPSVDERLQRCFAHRQAPIAAPVTLDTIDPQHLAVEALDAACALIQSRLGVTSGDLAGIFFSGSEVESILAAYVRSEIAVQTGETPRQLDPLSFRWEVPAAELDRPQVLSVNLRSCGNIDMGQDPDRPLFGVPTMPAHRVGSLRAAGQACRAYIERHGLGSSQWIGGWVRDGGNAIVAHVSYNGRVWFPNET